MDGILATFLPAAKRLDTGHTFSNNFIAPSRPPGSDLDTRNRTKDSPTNIHVVSLKNASRNNTAHGSCFLSNGALASDCSWLRALSLMIRGPSNLFRLSPSPA